MALKFSNRTLVQSHLGSSGPAMPAMVRAAAAVFLLVLLLAVDLQMLPLPASCV